VGIEGKRIQRKSGFVKLTQKGKTQKARPSEGKLVAKRGTRKKKGKGKAYKSGRDPVKEKRSKTWGGEGKQTYASSLKTIEKKK